MGFARAWIGALLPLVVAGAAANPEPGLAWRSWSPEVFAQAKREHKFVLLDLEAVWCHWCHVMDDVTYRDPAVRKELNAHYPGDCPALSFKKRTGAIREAAGESWRPVLVRISG